MAAKKPKPKAVKPRHEAPATLMGNQDTVNRGDSYGMEKVRYSFMIPAALLQKTRDYAAERGMSVTRLIIEGLNWRLKQED